MNTIKNLQKKLQYDSYHLRHEMERFSAQIKFAESLKKLYPKEASQWDAIIGSALKCVSELPELGSRKPLKDAIRKAENIMTPIAKFAKKYAIYCVGHAHIDMNWKWSWPETVAITNDTFSTVLKLMDEYPDFVFSQSQASIYEIIEKYNPEMLQKIRERVREKRWEVTASHWVESDKNMVCGEALSRHLLYTRNYIRELFQLTPEDVVIDWAPDTFGHAATVPSYLAHGGIKYCYLHRPGNLGARRPGMFFWQGPDGAKILVRNDMIHGYHGRVDSKIANNLIDFINENGGFSHMFVYGVGDHGGGPTRRDLNQILDMATWPVFPQIKFATARSFFEAFENESVDLPILDGELNVEFTGCYTTQSLIKKANRYSENRLADAEFAALTAWKILKQAYPTATLEKNWKKCLFNHFHDILPGSCVRDARHYTMGLFQEIMANTSMMETQALRKLASAIDTSKIGILEDLNVVPSTFYKDAFGAGGGIGASNGNLSCAEQSFGLGNRPFVIFNPTASERAEVIEVTIWDNTVPEESKLLNNKVFAVKTPEDKLTMTQFISEGIAGKHHYIKLAFPVKLNGFSYALYTIIETEVFDCKSSLKLLQSPHHHCKYASHERAAIFGCENEFVILEINPVTGGILRLRDKKSGQDIISPENQASMLDYTLERPRPMSSWLIDFSAKKEPLTIKSISYVTTGPHKIAIKVDAEINSSKISVIYEMEENTPLITINIKGIWLEVGNENIGCPSLRMPFPLNLESPKAFYEIPFGSIERDLNNDEEVPALQWAKVTGNKNQKTIGCLLLNDCKYGHALDDNILRISLIRSAYNPDPTPEVGEHEINLAILPFSGNLSNAKCTELGQRFNRKLKAIGTSVHKGDLPTKEQLIKISGANVVVSGLKKAENENAVILRLYEMEGKTAKIDITFSKIFGIPRHAVIVDFMERELKSAPQVNIKSNGVVIDIAANSIFSLMIYFA